MVYQYCPSKGSVLSSQSKKQPKPKPMKYLIRSLIVLALVAGTTSEGMAQLFRSANSGNWNAIGTWQQSTDGGASWGPAAATPTNASGEITVRAPHTVTVTAPVNLDDVTVEAGGTLTTTTGGIAWVINNGTFGVRIFGTFNANAGGGSFGCCGSVSVENGGVVNMNNGGAFFGPTTVQVGGTVIGNTPINLGGGTIVNHGTWTMTGTNGITLSGGGSLTNNGTMVWKGGTLSGTLTNNGTLTWSGGTITSSPLGVINNGASATFICNWNTAQNGSINNQGTFTWSAGTFLSFTAIGTFLNAPSATFNMAGNAGFNTFYQAVTNQGTINFSVAGSLLANPGTTLNNSGTINVNAGTWIWGHPTSNTGSLNIANGATLDISQSTTISGPVSNAGTLMGSIASFTGTTFTNNGSVTLTNLPFNGSAAQTLTGTGSISNLTMNNTNGLTLGGSQTVTGTLTLTNGRITLGNNDLVLSNTNLAALVGGNATNHIVTDSNGSFRRNLPVSGANYPFPIGTGASYLPMTLSNTSGPQERFGARVQNDVHSDYSTPGTPAGNVVVSEQVERTWVISEQTEGGNQATVQLQWNAGDEGANFGRTNCALHSYNATDWVALALGAAGGSNPYTRSASNVAVFREFTVADGESTLPFVCNNGLTPGSLCNDNDACTIDDVVTAGCQCAGTFQDADGDGTCDLNDGCPNDPNKTLPGSCGCGVSDVDSDNDGTLDCNDACPLDPNKIIPGDCGCGVSDLDSDDDGTADCNDGCPNDPLKISPGGCGCGTPEVDTNYDGACDGNSACTAFIAPHLSGIPDAGPAITIEPACPPSNVGFVLINICSDATGIYRLYDEVTDVVVDFGQMNGCGATGHGCPGGGLSCLWESWQLPAGPYSLRLYNDLSGSQPLACARIDFTVPGAEACCGGLGPVGTPCDDGNACTVNDSLNTSCLCVGVLLDSDSDGTCDADDACPMDPNKVAPGACGCGAPDVPQTYYADTDEDGFGDPNSTIAGYTCDQPTGYVLDNTDDCPTLPGRVGDSCNDGNAGTTGDVITAACVCLGTPIGDCTNYTLELQSGGGMANAVTYEVLDETGVATILSGNNPVPSDGVGTLNLCLHDGCYQLRITDSAGDGLLGYILRETGPNARRVIDNAFNMNDGVSQISAGGGFCLPLGDDRLIWSSCHKLDWIDNKFIVASSNTAVSAQFGITNTTSGYEFWFFDPNGGFSFRRFRSHATSDGTGSGATRACHFKVNGWFNTPSTPHLPDNVLLNVRIRGRVAGNNLPFGPACQFMLDAALAACPRVKLQDDPYNAADYSCGVSRNFGGGSSAANRIHAAPPQPIPSVPSNLVRYQFRFRIPSEGICIVRPPQTSARMVLNWTNGAPLQCTKTYEVDVRVSLDGGASWCFGPAGSSATTTCADTEDWGKVCLVTINPCAGVSGGTNAMIDGTNADPIDLLPDEQRVVLYPNPNHGDQLFLVMNDLEKEVHVVHMDILDLTGKRVMTRTIPLQAHGADADGSVNTNLTLSEDLSSGVYIVHLSVGDRDHIERLVIQR